jgi:YspA, cpYpsA-related SLOG family
VRGRRIALASVFLASYDLDMRILVTGDRYRVCIPLAERIVTRLIARYGRDLVIIHGGAPGVDNSFAEACRTFDIKAEAHLADWKGLGNIAGPACNREMVESGADLCIALHRSLETSKGTKDCVRQALAAGIAVYLSDSVHGVPKRLHSEDERLK